MHTNRILIADDEKEIRDILQVLLTGDGYEVVMAENGQEAVNMSNDTIDLYILDVNMPFVDGFTAAREIRKKSYAPILFLTAYSGETDKVMGFSAGADDYLVKPFSNIELLMRIRSLFRRARQYSENMREDKKDREQLRVDDLILDLKSQTALLKGEIIVFTYTEFKILELLARHRKKIYSLDNIYESIWGEDAVGDSTIMVHIKNIRKKLGDNSRQPKYIKTAWGKGYYVD